MQVEIAGLKHHNFSDIVQFKKYIIECTYKLKIID